MRLWLILLAGGLLTYLIRLSFIFLFGKFEIPAWLGRGLRYVPPAVLSAIIFPELLIRENKLDLSLGNAQLLAGIVAILVAWRTRNALITIVTGMAALFLFKFIFNTF